MNEEIAITLRLLPVFAFLGWLFWLDDRRRQAHVQARSELRNRLFEKFGSPQDVAQFLQTEGGERLLHGLTTDAGYVGRWILRATQAGVIVTVFGAMVVALGLMYPPERGANPGVIIGSLVLALGVGFLFSAGISYWLSKKWGMLDSERRCKAGS